MAIQYSGTTFATNFTCTTGTRREIVDGLAGALTSNGWTYVSGSGTGDVKVKTATTPEGSKTIMRIYDPGSGNCARIKLYNSTQTVNQAGDIFLLPAASKVFQVVGNGYQFCTYVTGSTTAREFAMGGTLWTPSFLTPAIFEQGWLMGNATTDTDTTTRPSFRTRSQTVDSGATYPNLAVYINNALWDGSNTNFGINWGPGIIQMAGIGPLMYRNGQSRTLHMTQWYDGSGMIFEPLIGWSPYLFSTNVSANSEGYILGQLWDAAGMTVAFTKDTTTTFDSHNWVNIMDNNTGSNQVFARCSLWLATS